MLSSNSVFSILSNHVEHDDNANIEQTHNNGDVRLNLEPSRGRSGGKSEGLFLFFLSFICFVPKVKFLLLLNSVHFNYIIFILFILKIIQSQPSGPLKIR